MNHVPVSHGQAKVVSAVRILAQLQHRSVARVALPTTSSQPLLAHAPAPPVAAAGPELTPRNPPAGGSTDVAPALGSALLYTSRSFEDILHPDTLSVLQEVYAAHSKRLASALEMASSEPGTSPKMRGGGVDAHGR